MSVKYHDQQIAGMPEVATVVQAGNGKPVTSGAVQSALDNIACRPNLLDNWYFVGGGSQQGGNKFPINQRGQTSYTGAWKSYGIDRWWFTGSTAPMTIESDGILFAGTSTTQVRQTIDISTYPKPITMTVSAIVKADAVFNFYLGCVTNSNTENANPKYYANGQRSVTAGSWQLVYGTFTIPTTDTNNYLSFYVQPVISGTASPAHNLRLKAAKIELGTMQTLAHQENGAWVLNEIPDYEEQLTRCKTNTVNSSDVYANDPIAFCSNLNPPNLLDNWFFVGGGSQQGGGQFPINQRGNTSSTSSEYFIDRWKHENAATKMELTADGLKIARVSGSTETSLMKQTLPSSTWELLAGKPVTLSFLLSDGSFASQTITLPSNTASSWDTGGPVISGLMYMDINGTPSTNSCGVRFIIQRTTTTPYTIVAVKFEIGNAQTLAHREGGVWVLNEIPNFQQELAKCQRYYERFLSIIMLQPIPAAPTYAIAANGNFKVRKRATPTIAFDGKYYDSDGVNVIGNATINYVTADGIVTVHATSGTPSGNTVYSMKSVAASADL